MAKRKIQVLPKNEKDKRKNKKSLFALHPRDDTYHFDKLYGEYKDHTTPKVGVRPKKRTYIPKRSPA